MPKRAKVRGARDPVLTMADRCGCKGIRSCLLCEDSKGKSENSSVKHDQVSYDIITSLLHVFSEKLNWVSSVLVFRPAQKCTSTVSTVIKPGDKAATKDIHITQMLVLSFQVRILEHLKVFWAKNIRSSAPKELEPHTILLCAGILLLTDFLSHEEEITLASTIDSTPWMESQSGRRKQVNAQIVLCFSEIFFFFAPGSSADNVAVNFSGLWAQGELQEEKAALGLLFGVTTFQQAAGRPIQTAQAFTRFCSGWTLQFGIHTRAGVCHWRSFWRLLAVGREIGNSQHSVRHISQYEQWSCAQCDGQRADAAQKSDRPLRSCEVRVETRHSEDEHTGSSFGCNIPRTDSWILGRRL